LGDPDDDLERNPNAGRDAVSNDYHEQQIAILIRTVTD
jgi:hypothetical protein